MAAVISLGDVPAYAAITSPDAAAVAASIKAADTVVTGASWTAAPDGTPNGVSDAPLGGFPTEGSTFAILTNGDVNAADEAQSSPRATTDLGGANVRGNTDFDVSVLKVNFTVPERMDCVRFDFRFLSEEYPDFVGQEFNDAFIAELDSSNWSTSGSTITAPNNFAFDPAGKPISINAAGNTSMSAGPASTIYNGATPILTAAHTVSPGAHSLYLSIFDQGDHRVDSAVLVDNLVVGHAPNATAQCVPGAAPKEFGVTLTPPTGSHPVGASHTVTATVKEVGAGPVDNGKVLFTVAGANTTTGNATTNASGVATFSYSGTALGGDSVTACYDVNGNGTCAAGEPLASVAVTWTAGPTPTATPTPAPLPPGNGGLPVTGSPTGLIAGAGVLVLLLGVAGYFVIRRRRVRFVAE
jgi:LPXTG-motif cell wall-anchored protein